MSFHKPKVFRSSEGCCICGAKSSSSRFTSSKPYEPYFAKTFLLTEHRSGQICNACVLIVKRAKKLPPGSKKHWAHVVDARRGPGTKSMNKIKNRHLLSSKDEEEKRLKDERFKKKHKHIRRKTPVQNAEAVRAQSPSCSFFDDIVDDCDSDDTEISSASDSSNENTVISLPEISHRPSKTRRKSRKPTKHASFLYMNYWKREEICCGTIFVGPERELLLNMDLMHICDKKKSKKIGEDSTCQVTLYKKSCKIEDSSCQISHCSNSGNIEDSSCESSLCSKSDDSDSASSDDVEMPLSETENVIEDQSFTNSDVGSNITPYFGSADAAYSANTNPPTPSEVASLPHTSLMPSYTDKFQTSSNTASRSQYIHQARLNIPSKCAVVPKGLNSGVPLAI